MNEDELVIINNTSKSNIKVRRLQSRQRSSPILKPPNSVIIEHLDGDETTPTDSTLGMKHKSIPVRSQITPSPSTMPTIPTSPTARVNSSIPKVVTMTRDCLLQSIGFRKPDSIIKNMKHLASTSIQLERDQNPRIDPGETASMKASRRNTSPSTPSLSYSNVWHLDIGYGPCTAIGGIKYTLLAVDKHSRYKLVYGLKNLKSSLHDAIAQFISDCGVTPKLIRTDFDTKIIGGRPRHC